MPHVEDPQCVFCKIVAGTIPSARVLEDEHAVVFLDIGPLNPGHTLVVPKCHHPDLAQLPDDIAAHSARLLPRVCRAVRAATNADGLNVLVNIGRIAGQSVDHVHWHVIPRHANDSLRWPWPAGKYDSDAMEQMRSAIASALRV